MLRIAKWAGNLLLVLVIVIALFLFLAPRFTGLTLLVVLSQSMEPAISIGDMVVVTPVDPKDVAVGDIITFRPPDPREADNAVTHRVIDIRRSGLWPSFRTMGDASNAPDQEWLPASHLIGRVRFHVPFLGYAVSFLRTPLGFVLLLVVPTAFVIGRELWSMIGSARKKTAKDSEQTVLVEQQ